MADDNGNQPGGDSPEIEHIKWGFMKVKGYPPGKDFKLFPGGAENWDWNKTNTRHVPGIQIEDVDDLIKRGAEIIVLSKGMENKLETPETTVEFLEAKKMILNEHYFIETTLDAYKLYNQFANDKKRVGALIHSTC